MDNLYEIYLEQAKLMHQNPKYWKGHMIKKYMPQIEEVIKEHNIDTNSILDYGCGKGNQYIESHLNILFHIPDDNIFMYDPGFDEHKKLPDRKFDGVISTDVMEHIPEEIIPKTLNQIFERAEKFVYLAICTRPAIAILPNGENAHCTVEKPDWWEPHILKANKNKVWTEVNWYGNHNDYRKYNTTLDK